MYTLDEVLPFIYSEINEDPTVKDGIFSDNEARGIFYDQMSDLIHEPYGECTLNIPAFTGTNDETGETRSFEAKTFTFNVTESLKEHDDYCEGKAWSHYETYMTDVETQQQYSLFAYYYETNGDLIGISVDKIKPKVKKPKKAKTMFVAVVPTPEDYNILGIFQKLEKAVEVQNRDDVQIEEVPINCQLVYNPNSNLRNMISGALNVYDFEGNPIK